MLAADTITIIGPAGTTFLTTAGDYQVTDSTSGSIHAAGAAATVATKNGSSTNNETTFSTGVAYSAGDQLSVVVSNVTNPNVAGSYTLSVSTSEDQTSVTSNSYSLSGSPSAVYSVSTSSQVPSGTATYTLSGIVAATAFVKGTSLIGVDAYSNNGTTASTVAFPAGAANYTVTDVTSGASAVASTVSAETAIVNVSTVGEYVNITSPIAIASGDAFTVQITGMTNPGQEKQNVDVATSAGPAAPTIAVPYTGDSGNFLIGTSVSGVTLSLSNSGAGSTSNYTVGVTSTSAIASSGTITLTAPAGTTFPSIGASAGYGIVDNTTTTGSAIAVTVALSMGSGSSTNNVVAITLPNAIAKGDSLTITATGVTNTTAGSYANFSVASSANIIPVNAPSFTLSASQALSTTLSSATAGGVSNWTIGNFQAGTSGIAKGDTIEVVASDTSTVFPSAASQYQLVDLTNSASTTSSMTLTVNSSHDVTLALPAAIAANDALQLVITGTLNPTAASTKDTVSLIAGTTGDIAYLTAAVVTAAPNAATTGANGALVNDSGTIYVYAGGVAFGIPTPADFNAISASVGNPTVVTASSVTTTGTVRNGTLLQVVGSPEIGVVDSGTFTGFSTASQFLSDGYSFANVIQVPNLGSLTTGTGTPANAAATASDGALVNVSGTIYVYAGGVATGIPTPAVFSTISAAEGNPTVVTATSVTTTGNMATGTLVQVVGSAQVNVVTSTGTQVGFGTASEFTGDGYSWGKVVMIP